MLRHDILRHAYVKRYSDGDLISAQGHIASEWFACAKGAVRISSNSRCGKQVALSYLEPGIWFGDVSILDGGRRTHDAHAKGATTILCVSSDDFKAVLASHAELGEAMLRLHARRIRHLYGQLEDIHTLPQRARLAKQLLQLARSHGVPDDEDETETVIGLQLAQEELACLLGASRQRVNQQLKAMERQGAIRIERGGLAVRDEGILVQIIGSGGSG